MCQCANLSDRFLPCCNTSYYIVVSRGSRLVRVGWRWRRQDISLFNELACLVYLAFCPFLKEFLITIAARLFSRECLVVVHRIVDQRAILLVILDQQY